MSLDRSNVGALMLYGVVGSVAMVIGLFLTKDLASTVFLVLAGGWLLMIPFQERMAFSMVMATFQSALIMPFAPGRPFLWELALAVAIPSMVISILLRRGSAKDRSRSLRQAKWILLGAALYCVVLLGTMYVRGVGLRVFGATAAGGRVYFQQILCIFWPVLCVLVSVSERQFTRLFILHLVMAATYLVSELAFSVAPDIFSPLLQFFELSSDMVNFELQSELVGIRRYQSLGVAAPAGIFLLLVLNRSSDFLGLRALWLWPLLALLGGASLLSGHRAVIIITTLIVLAYAWAMRAIVARNILAVGVAVGLLLWPVYLLADRLPLAAQRALSILPGLRIASVAAADAQATYFLRIELSKLGWTMIPDYFWVGRGFTRFLDDASLRIARANMVEYHLQAGQFYNGFISQMVSTGVVGTVAILVFAFGAAGLAMRVIRLVRQSGDEDLFARVSALAACMYLVKAFFFFFVNGYSAYTLTALAPLAGMLLVCNRLLEHRLEAAETSVEATESLPVTSPGLASETA